MMVMMVTSMIVSWWYQSVPDSTMANNMMAVTCHMIMFIDSSMMLVNDMSAMIVADMLQT